MPDNVNITPGTGATIAADDIGGVQHQRVKLSIGADGTAADLAHGQGLMAASLPVVIASNQTAIPVSGSVSVSGTVAATGPLTNTEIRATALPISGTVAVSNLPATQAISAAALPLPAGASIAAKQAALGVAGTPSTDVLTVQGAALMTALKVDGSAVTQPVSGAVSVSNFPATQAVSIAATLPVSGPLTDTQLRFAAVPVSGAFFQATQPVSAAALPLPAGAATAANQIVPGTAGIPGGNVVSVQGITSMVALKVDGSAVTQPVSIAATVAVSGVLTDAQIRATALPVSGTVTANAGTGTLAVSAAALPLPAGAATEASLVKIPVAQASATSGQSGALVQGAVTTGAPTYVTAQTSPLSLTVGGALRVDGSAATQPVSGTVTANAGTGTMAVSGPLTDAQLRAVAVPVSGTFFQGTQPVSIAATVSENLAQVAGVAVSTAAAGIQKVGMTDSLGGSQFNFPAGFVRQSDEPRQVFYEPFDATPDVTNMWTSATGNSAVAASVTTGVMSMGTGTVASGWSKFFSIPTFKLPVPAWMGFSFAINIPDLAAPTANSYRFWGSGIPATTPTTTAPLTDAVGFELATDGKMYAVAYAGGTRTVVQDLSAATGNAKQPTDALSHRYIVYVRTDRSYWYIDGLSSTNLVATSNFQSPSNQTLPLTFLAVGAAVPPLSNAQIQASGTAAWDTGKNATQIADATFPWRKAAVSSTGSLSVQIVDTQKATYMAVSTSFAPGATPQDIFTLTGSATKTIRITRVSVDASATAATVCPIFFTKRSSAHTGGTSAAVTRVPVDSASAAATGTVLSWTANSTGGGVLVGNLAGYRTVLPTPASIMTHPLIDFDFTQGPTQAVVLRGIAEVFGVNLAGITAIAGWLFHVTIVWTEE